LLDGHGLDAQSVKKISQVGPEKPHGHWQVNPVPLKLHTPSFMHGVGSQAETIRRVDRPLTIISIPRPLLTAAWSQIAPMKYLVHWHVNEDPIGVQIPMFMQGLTSHGLDPTDRWLICISVDCIIMLLLFIMLRS